MNAALPSHAPIRFGIFELDTESRELRKRGVKIRLQEQPFQILQVLLEHPGSVVTREELQQRIWPSDTFVDFDRGLYNAIKKLREALGDSADTPRYIETLSRRGYRFIAAVNGNGSRSTGVAETLPLAAARSEAKRNLRIGVALVIGAAVFLGAAFSMRTFSGRSSAQNMTPQIRSIAVLPLQNLSSDPTQEYFSEGMTDALITDLAQISALKVVSRTTALRYKGTGEPLPQIARELNVDGIVEGTVQRSADRVRITAQLIYGAADRHLWAKSYERDVKDILALESTIASEIADEIQVKVTPMEQARLNNGRPVNPKALDAYVEARFHIDQAEKLDLYKGKQASLKGALRKAFSDLDLAVQEDPGYIPAYVAYFDAVQKTGFTSQLEFLPKAKAALQKALEADEANAEAHLAFGDLLMQYEYDWAGAEREYLKAIQLSPNSGDAHFHYSEYLKNVGRITECHKEFDIAQALNPAHDYLADASTPLSRDRTLEQERQALEEQFPNDPVALGVMGKEYAIAGRYQDAVEIYERFLALLGWHDFVDVLKRADARGGPKFALEELMRAAEKYAQNHNDLSVVGVAFTYASLGNKDRAFAWLDKAVEQRNWMIIYLKDDNVWDPLRSDPRFDDLLRRVGLPPGQSSLASASSH